MLQASTHAPLPVRFSRPVLTDKDGHRTNFHPCPPDVLQKINLRYLYSADAHPVKVLCPSHQDGQEPNLAVYPGNTHCFACGFHEGAFEHIKRVVGTLSYAETIAIAELIMEGRARKKPHTEVVLPISLDLVRNYQEELLGASHLQAYLSKRYGLRVSDQRAASLGYSSIVKAYTIPVFSLDGAVQNIRYRSNDEASKMKYWGMQGHNNTRWFYSPSILKAQGTLQERVRSVRGKDVVIVTEGEFDTLALDSIGLPAISATSGAMSLVSVSDTVEALARGLRGLTVMLAYDQDGPGQEAAAKVRDTLGLYGVPAGVLRWDSSYGKDPSELVSVGINFTTFRHLCKLKIAPKDVENRLDISPNHQL